MSLGQFVHLFPEVRVLFPHAFQLCLNLGGGAVGLEAELGDNGLFGTFRCHGGHLVVEM